MLINIYFNVVCYVCFDLHVDFQRSCSFTLRFLLLCNIREFMFIYISFLLLYRKDISRINNLLSFYLNFVFSFLIKKIIFENKSIDVQKVRGSFRWTRSEPMGYRILGEERNQIFLPVQWACFLSKDSVCASTQAH